ncbi:MAG: TatD family deoxyribonuclease [Firmicutes bacterium]|nr:TatD family deoxyribonuclease [Bacillota bacterium]
MFTDTHCHLYNEYYEEGIDSIYEKMEQSKINRVINNGCDSKSNKEVIELLGKYSWMYGAIGIHPESADTYTEEDLKYVEEHINDPKVVAVGEIGLDYYWTKENKDKQKELFEYQLALAERVNKPVIIHSREATQDTIDILKKYKVTGVIHSFSGSYETACIYIKMGYLLGINGVITFKNCNLKDVVEKLDLGNIVLETDSPYLTPVPYRGKRNDPSHVWEIAEYIANLKGVSVEELSKETNGNIARFFDI